MHDVIYFIKKLVAPLNRPPKPTDSCRAIFDMINTYSDQFLSKFLLTSLKNNISYAYKYTLTL